MILLTTTSDVLRIVTSFAADIDVFASFIDRNGSTDTPGNQDAAITTATTTSIVSAPGASTYRNVRNISIRNKDAVDGCTVTVQFYDGVNAREVIKATLAAGESMNYEDGYGWSVFESGITPAGSSGQIQYNASGSFGAAAKATVDANGSLVLALDSSPITPGADTIGLFGRKVGGRMLPAIMGPSGLDTALQPHNARNKISTWFPAGNSVTIVANGNAALTATGTATAANVAVTNRHTYQKRLEYLVTVAATTAVAGYRGAAAQWTIGGPSTGAGGFHFICRWGPATGVATATNRAFVGMSSSTSAPTDVEPSTQTNCAGVGWDAADTNMQFMYNDAAGTCTKVDLGASFPVPTSDRTEAYEIAMFSPPGGTQSVSYEVTNLATGSVATGTVTTDLPTTSTLLAPRGWMSVGGTSSVIGIALMSLYIESDF
jgi:hypothetical protein